MGIFRGGSEFFKGIKDGLVLTKFFYFSKVVLKYISSFYINPAHGIDRINLLGNLNPNSKPKLRS